MKRINKAIVILRLTYAIYAFRVSAVEEPTSRSFSGTKLLAIRNAAKMSRFELTRAINFAVGTQAIIRYERGGGVPTLDVALKIADALEVPVEALTDAKG